MATNQRTHLNVIDGMRGVGVLIILLGHQLHELKLLSVHNQKFMQFGYVFLLGFFVASAILIGHGLDINSKIDPHWIKHFFIRRATRILPVWWLILTVHWLLGYTTFKVVLINATFLFGFLAWDPVMAPVYVAWSLFVEETFYVVAPFLLVRLTTFRSLWLTMIGAFFVAATYDHFMNVPLYLPFKDFLDHMPIRFYSFFFMGILFQRYYFGRESEFIAKPFTPIPLALDSLIIAAFVMQFNNIFIHFELILFLMMIASFTKGTLTHWIFTRPIFCWVGIRCYTLYLLHRLLCFYWLEPLRADYWPTNPYLQIVVDFAITILVADLCWRFYEKPWIRFGRKLTQGHA